MNLGDIFGRVLDTLAGNGRERRHQGDVLPASQDPYGDPADTWQGHQVLDASQDPYGDPADQYQGRQVLDASQDPYGDPADTWQGHQVLDASQDPYGDPADEEEEYAQRRGGWFNR